MVGNIFLADLDMHLLRLHLLSTRYVLHLVRNLCKTFYYNVKKNNDTIIAFKFLF